MNKKSITPVLFSILFLPLLGMGQTAEEIAEELSEESAALKALIAEMESQKTAPSGEKKVEPEAVEAAALPEKKEGDFSEPTVEDIAKAFEGSQERMTAPPVPEIEPADSVINKKIESAASIITDSSEAKKAATSNLPNGLAISDSPNIPEMIEEKPPADVQATPPNNTSLSSTVGVETNVQEIKKEMSGVVKTEPSGLDEAGEVLTKVDETLPDGDESTDQMKKATPDNSGEESKPSAIATAKPSKVSSASPGGRSTEIVSTADSDGESDTEQVEPTASARRIFPKVFGLFGNNGQSESRQQRKGNIFRSRQSETDSDS